MPIAVKWLPHPGFCRYSEAAGGKKVSVPTRKAKPVTICEGYFFKSFLATTDPQTQTTEEIIIKKLPSISLGGKPPRKISGSLVMIKAPTRPDKTPIILMIFIFSFKKIQP